MSQQAPTESCRRRMLLLCCAVLGSLANNAVAVIQDPVETGREALQRSRIPWYDPTTDELRQVELPVKAPPLTPKNWVYQPTGPTRTPSWLAGIARFLQYSAWVFLAVVIAVLLFFAIKSFTALADANRMEDDFDEHDERTEADRIEQLPFQVSNETGSLLAYARQLYEQGKYAEAIVYLFSYELVEMDKAHLIRLTKGKTNRQYLRELSPKLGLRSIVQQTMVVFEDVFFGHYPLSRERFESCWNRLTEFQREIETQRSAMEAAR